MLNLQSSSHPAHETPVKRKAANHEPHTAESDQPSLQSLSDLDARDLFEKFDQLVRVSVDEEPFSEDFEDEVARRLDYERPRALKLSFETPCSSMKKKSRAPVLPLPAINLFRVPLHKPQVKKEEPLIQGACKSPERTVRTEGAWVQRAARKEQQGQE